MKKGTWVSAFGWACFACWLFALAAFVLARGTPTPPIPRALASLAVLASVPCFGLWALGTLVHKITMASARAHATELVKAQALAAGLVCRKCQRAPAVLRCQTHGLELCGACCQAHNQPGCQYGQVSQVVKPAMAVVGSGNT